MKVPGQKVVKTKESLEFLAISLTHLRTKVDSVAKRVSAQESIELLDVSSRLTDIIAVVQTGTF